MGTGAGERPYVIVVGIDFEPDGDLALAEAVAVAGVHARAEIHVLHVGAELVPASWRLGADASALDRDVSHQPRTKLDELDAHVRDRLRALRMRGRRNVSGVYTSYRVGSPARHLVAFAVELDADLVVVGTHGRRGIARMLLGSVAASVLRRARCPVLVVRPRDHAGIGEVPEIEPLCAECIAARRASGGETRWCTLHARRHHGRPAHVYHYVESGASPSQPPWGTGLD
jgi:nucleotide-binding universal stress UspA family protein